MAKKDSGRNNIRSKDKGERVKKEKVTRKNFAEFVARRDADRLKDDSFIPPGFGENRRRGVEAIIPSRSEVIPTYVMRPTTHDQQEKAALDAWLTKHRAQVKAEAMDRLRKRVKARMKAKW